MTVKMNNSFSVKNKLSDYRQLIKFSLSFMVTFSAVISYLLAPNVVELNWKFTLLFFLGGMLVTGSANAVNQAVEKDTDAQMKRTASRPVASGRMSEMEAWTFAVVSLLVGLFILAFYFNVLSAVIAFISWLLYAFVYTPLKKVNSISVLVGAVPGALPCLIGWTAGQDELSAGGWVLFAIQFFWQFPHFWAIAWLAHNDYSKAGFKLLPSVEGPGKYSAIQSIIYSMVMIPVGFLPYFVKISGFISFWILLAANLWMVYLSWNLYVKMEASAARKVMFGSYFYLPIVMFALLLDKLPIVQ
ncbi:heme o synthase [Gynurincola endophyticus]|jgi:protoheme IX farnesyltransferase|uniref:heme o synthase n=1 Tax=Gynurincola endophyticus TaxID=2479004 RepID=UPI0018F28BC9|nr:heme o synthase [Gynurincola endophyticus]